MTWAKYLFFKLFKSRKEIMNLKSIEKGFYQSDIMKWTDNVAGHETSGEGRLFLTFYDQNKFVFQRRKDRIELSKEELLDTRYETGIFEVEGDQLNLIFNPDKKYRRTETIRIINDQKLLYDGIHLSLQSLN